MLWFSKTFSSFGLWELFLGPVLFLSANIYRVKVVIIWNWGKRWVLSDILRFLFKYFSPKKKKAEGKLRVVNLHFAISEVWQPEDGIDQLMAAGSCLCQVHWQWRLGIHWGSLPFLAVCIAFSRRWPHMPALLVPCVFSVSSGTWCTPWWPTLTIPLEPSELGTTRGVFLGYLPGIFLEGKWAARHCHWTSWPFFRLVPSA